jgi:ferredoxin/flavodoxin---NADP+ reductase
MTLLPDSTTYEPALLTIHEQIAPDVFRIGIRRLHDFFPGQSVKLGVNRTDPPRIYSICSGPDEDDLCILFSVKPGGLLTPALARLSVGDSVWISEPYGTFVVGDEPSWMIATGTGIAPFYARLQAGAPARTTLVHGVRRTDQFYFEPVFCAELGTRYHRCCSREQRTGLFNGRVTRFLASRPALPPAHSYYICGQARMAVEVRDLLLTRGVSHKKIKTEIYF